ncbi:MAG: family 16 glycosylhydrolase [Bacteroidota bacterium]
MENCLSSRLKWKAMTGSLSTARYEKEQQKLSQKDNRISKIKASDTLKEYNELESYINSGDFDKEKKETESLKYSGSEAWQKEKEYRKKKKDARIKDYYKMKGSQELNFYENHKDAEKLKRFLELKDYVNSDKFKADKKEVANHRQNELDKIKQKRSRHKTLKKQYKWFLKLEESGDFKDFLHFKDSDTFKHFLELKAEVSNYSLSHLKKKLKTERKQLLKEKKTMEKRFKALKDEARKADKNKETFEHQKELDRLKESLGKGTIDQKLKDTDLEQSHEYIKINEFRELQKNKRIKNASKFYFSDKYKKYLDVKDKDEIAELKDLEKYMDAEYKSQMAKAKAITYKNSDAYKWYQEYRTLKKDPDIKKVIKIEKSKKLKNYKALEGSGELQAFEELKAYINSEDFKKQKAWLKDSKRFKKTEAYKKLQKFKALKKSEDIKYYLKHKDDKDLQEFSKWELTFEDTFSGDKLTNWSATPYGVSDFIKGTFSQWNEDQCYMESGNHKVAGNKLVIETKKEPAEGKAWNPQMGFLPKKFNYTSAKLHNGNVFKQKYGKFEVKARMDFASPVKHIIALSSGRPSPQIQLAAFGQKPKSTLYQTALVNSAKGQNESAKADICTLKGAKLNKDYHIFALEWTRDHLEWKLNGVTVSSENKNIPEAGLFFTLFSEVSSEQQKDVNHAVMEVDWVRAYHLKDTE